MALSALSASRPSTARANQPCPNYRHTRLPSLAKIEVSKIDSSLAGLGSGGCLSWLPNGLGCVERGLTLLFRGEPTGPGVVERGSFIFAGRVRLGSEAFESHSAVLEGADRR